MNVVMPQLGETVKEGTVTVWHKKVGDQVKEGERLFEVTTEKVDTEIPAPASGVLSALLVAEGQTVQVGTTLAVIEEPGKAVGVQPSAQRNAPEFSSSGSQAVARDSQRDSPASDRHGAERLSPVVRKLIAEHNLDPAEIRGSGAGGRITRDDVLAHLERRKAPAGPSQPGRGVASPGERAPLSRIRKRTAEQMALSWRTIPHVFQAMEVDFSAVEQARAARGEAWNAKEGWSLTYLPFVAHALCAALTEFPVLNAAFEGDSLLLHSTVNLGIAVDLGREGLIVPVVKEANRKSLPELARAIRSLVEKARSRQLAPDDVTEGTYTVSSSGNFGTFFTAPIINPPQVAILSIDGVTRKPIALQEAGGESVAIRPVAILGQSFDHRALDGAYSAAFLRRLKAILEGREWLSALG